MFGDKLCSDSSIHLPLESSPFRSLPPQLNLLRSYNQILSARELGHFYHLALLKDTSGHIGNRKDTPPSSLLGGGSQNSHFSKNPSSRPSQSFNPFSSHKLPSAPLLSPPALLSSELQQTSPNSLDQNICLIKRQRGEKRPIPEEQKDEKYFERRKRNNEAAKKSRDARKQREDRIAFRAAILEQENSILKTQIFTLREEVNSLREQLLYQNNLK